MHQNWLKKPSVEQNNHSFLKWLGRGIIWLDNRQQRDSLRIELSLQSKRHESGGGVDDDDTAQIGRNWPLSHSPHSDFGRGDIPSLSLFHKKGYCLKPQKLKA